MKRIIGMALVWLLAACSVSSEQETSRAFQQFAWRCTDNGGSLSFSRIDHGGGRITFETVCTGAKGGA